MSDKNLLYVGTYTNTRTHADNEHPDAIYVFSFNAESGALEPVSTVNDIVNPTYLTVNNAGTHLYAVSEVGDASASYISAYRIDTETHTLTRINSQSSLGRACAWVTLDHTEQMVMIANYGGGEAAVAVLPLAEDGSLLPAADSYLHKGEGTMVDAGRQEASHPHQFLPDPTNTYALSADLGLDQVIPYRIDADTKTITVMEDAIYHTAPGAGPRHVAYHATLPRVYVINELNNTVDVLHFDREPFALTHQQTISTLPEGFTEYSKSSAVVISPDGRFLYTGNRGHQSIAIFAIDQATGALTAVGHQTDNVVFPRDFTIDPSGKFMLVGNKDDDSVVVFRINSADGTLTDTGVKVACGTPVCLHLVMR